MGLVCIHVGLAYAELKDPYHSGHHRVVTTKDCLVFLDGQDEESLPAHLLPQSYARCLRLTRKAIRERETDSRILNSADQKDENSLQKEEHTLSSPPTKKYYRVQTLKEKESE